MSDSIAPVLVVLCQFSIAAVFVAALTGKALDATNFVGAIRLTGVPARLVSPGAAALIVVEALCAAALVQSAAWLLWFGFGASAILFAGFSAWALWVIRNRPGLKCGCFGSSQESVGPTTIVRNLTLSLVAVVGLLTSLGTNSPLPGASVSYELSVVGIVVLATLIRAFWVARPALALSLNDATNSRRANGRD